MTKAASILSLFGPEKHMVLGACKVHYSHTDGRTYRFADGSEIRFHESGHWGIVDKIGLSAHDRIRVFEQACDRSAELLRGEDDD